MPIEHNFDFAVSFAHSWDHEIVSHAEVGAANFDGATDKRDRISMSREVHSTIVGVHDGTAGGKPVPSKKDILDKASNNSEVLGIKAAIDTECRVYHSNSHNFGTVDGSTPSRYGLVRTGGKMG